jgi:hypothetical protein
MMRSYLLGVAFLLAVIVANGQDRLESTGSFGEPIDKKGAVSVKKLAQKMDEAESLDIKVKGTITEVCQAKGCWMTLDLGNDELMRVKFKDYGFFVPKDAVGKTAIIKGIAKNEIVGVDELKHLAEDAGKSEKEINAIDKPKEELTFVAEGVIIK